MTPGLPVSWSGSCRRDDIPATAHPYTLGVVNDGRIRQ